MTLQSNRIARLAVIAFGAASLAGAAFAQDKMSTDHMAASSAAPADKMGTDHMATGAMKTDHMAKPAKGKKKMAKDAMATGAKTDAMAAPK